MSHRTLVPSPLDLTVFDGVRVAGRRRFVRVADACEFAGDLRAGAFRALPLSAAAQATWTQRQPRTDAA